MPKRHTYEEINEEFTKRDYKLLDQVYKNNKTKLKYICNKHPEEVQEIIFNSIVTGQGCRHCGREVCSDKRRTPMEIIRGEFTKRGYVLKDDTYVNNSTKMRYICPHHPDKETSICYNHLKSGKGCPYCSNNKNNDIESVRREFENKGLNLLEMEYVSNKNKMKFICPHHKDKVQNICLSSLRASKTGCKYCAIASRTKESKLDLSVVKEKFFARGYILLDQEYTNSSSGLKYICPKHPEKIKTISYNSLHRGSGCRECGYESITGENSSVWLGGVTNINRFLRYHLKDWSNSYIIKNNYVCCVSGKGGDLHVHHSKSFNQIRKMIFRNLNMRLRSEIGEYAEDELKEIIKELVKLHDDVIGFPLKPDIHNLFHSVYGKKSNTIEQFYEFKERYIIGEFGLTHSKDQEAI